MAGKPRARRRQEEAARAARAVTPRAKPVTAGTRAKVLARAEEVGAAAAGAELSPPVSAATVRKWRQRAKDTPAIAEPLPASDTAAAPTVPAEDASRAEQLRAEEQRDLLTSRQARDQADVLLGKGMTREAGDALRTADGFATRARTLGDAARAEELHESALAEATGEAVLELIARAFEDLALPVPRDFLQALLRGWPAPVAGDVVDHARQLVEGPVRARLRSSIEAEVAAQRFEARHAPAESDEPPEQEQRAAGAAGDGDDETPAKLGMSDVRDSLRRTYAAAPHQAIVAEQNQRERERQAARPGARRSRRRHWATEFQGPGLQDMR